MKNKTFIEEECPICKTKCILFSYKEKYIYCTNCDKYAVKFEGKFIPIMVKSSNPAIEIQFIDIEDTIISKDKIEISCRPCIGETKEEKEDASFTIMIANNGYNQENTVPIYSPIEIENEWYIFGQCNGIRLNKRSCTCYAGEDKHVLLQFISEDDGNWFIARGLNFSSDWINDYKKVMEITEEFLKNKDIFEPDICDGIQYGYKYKK